jgi:hypothetical protein
MRCTYGEVIWHAKTSVGAAWNLALVFFGGLGNFGGSAAVAEQSTSFAASRAEVRSFRSPRINVFREKIGGIQRKEVYLLSQIRYTCLYSKE